MALKPGAKLGPYEVLALLGSGGMSEVYRARDVRLGRDVAIKVLRGERPDPNRLRRFEQEARAAGALNHPNVVAVYDVGAHPDAPYVVTELLEGCTLGTRLESGALPVKKALDYGLQIAHGLAAAHDKGIVHRDLKPDNVFLTDGGPVKILDFGLAKLTRSDVLARTGEHTATEAGVVLGTVGFMSPEQVRGEQVDHRSDIFSFGAVLYQMLTGQRAFRCDTAVETMTAILKEDPPEVAAVREGISPGVARIVGRCIEKRAVDRFHSAHDLALALDAVSSASSSPAPEGDDGSAVARAIPPRTRFIEAATLVAVGLVAVGVYRGLDRFPEPPASDSIASVAVLPFENVGGDPDGLYLSDGVAEAIINELSRLPDLKVIARSTTFRFRGSEVDPRRVGRDLGVGAVLTGRVSQRGARLVIAAELVDVVQGTQLWGEQYDTGMGDIVAAYEEIANDISRRLRLRLAPREETLPARRHTENSEAYRLYLKSRYEQNRFNAEGIRKALDYARQATEQDPTFAPAHATLAKSYNMLGQWELLPAREANSMARAAAAAALELDERLPEGHLALGHAMQLDWDWAGTNREFERAIELDPNSADGHTAYGSHLVRGGRRAQEGIRHLKLGAELDPLAAWRRGGLVWAYYFDRQFDQALGQVQDALEFDGSLDFHSVLGMIHRERGSYAEAIAEFRKAGSFAEGGCHGHLGNTYARAGSAGKARECLRELEARWGTDLGSYGMALVYAGLGEADPAFASLEKAFERRIPGMSFLMVDPPLDPLRSDPRFEELLRRMSFPE